VIQTFVVIASAHLVEERDRSLVQDERGHRVDGKHLDELWMVICEQFNTIMSVNDSRTHSFDLVDLHDPRVGLAKIHLLLVVVQLSLREQRCCQL